MSAEPRAYALRQYSVDYERFAERGQELTGDGLYIMAEGAHGYALMLLRAYRAETDDPEPGPAPCSICGGLTRCDMSRVS